MSQISVWTYALLLFWLPFWSWATLYLGTRGWWLDRSLFFLVVLGAVAVPIWGFFAFRWFLALPLLLVWVAGHRAGRLAYLSLVAEFSDDDVSLRVSDGATTSQFDPEVRARPLFLSYRTTVQANAVALAVFAMVSVGPWISDFRVVKISLGGIVLLVSTIALLITGRRSWR